jgi:hypothetical protein
VTKQSQPSGCSLSKDDLVVEGVWLIDYFVADLVKGFGDSLILGRRVLLSTLNLVDGYGFTFGSHEDLGQVSWLFV